MLQASGYNLKTMTVSSSEFLISMVDKWEVLRRKKQKLIFKGAASTISKEDIFERWRRQRKKGKHEESKSSFNIVVLDIEFHYSS